MRELRCVFICLLYAYDLYSRIGPFIMKSEKGSNDNLPNKSLSHEDYIKLCFWGHNDNYFLKLLNYICFNFTLRKMIP